eukprot:sb/3476762/
MSKFLKKPRFEELMNESGVTLGPVDAPKYDPEFTSGDSNLLLSAEERLAYAYNPLLTVADSLLLCSNMQREEVERALRMALVAIAQYTAQLRHLRRVASLSATWRNPETAKTTL